MRGSQFPEYSYEMLEAIMMSRYNQSYPDIQNMPLRKVLFFARLVEAENQYEKQEADKQKAQIKGKSRFRRR